MPPKRSGRKISEITVESDAISKNMASSESANSGIKIPTFSGTRGESAKFWLVKFEQVMKLKKVKNEVKCIQLFLLLEGQAEIWYHTLPEDTQGNYEKLKETFEERFPPGASDRVANVSSFRGLVQQSGEATDDFIEKVIRMGQDINKGEQEIIDQIYQGLHPVIMKFVAQKEAKTLSDVRKFARMGQSLEGSAISSEMEINKLQGQETFRQNDHDGLFPKDDAGKEKLFDGKEGEWAVTIAEHLLTKLAVDLNYVMARYSALQSDCLKELTGKKGDTSFGCEQGWHGSVDIIMENNLPVQLLKEPLDTQDTQDCTEGSVSSIEIKSNENFVDADEKQLLAQTIVFSFLQMKYNELKLKHSLIPAIGISTKHLYINFYDCINDVYLSSDTALEMFDERGGKCRVLVEIVVLLWLTLNYRYFCSGITEEMKNCKADFHKRLDDMISVYSEKFQRPVHVSSLANKQHEKKNWAAVRGKKVEKVFEKNEYFEI